MKSKTLSVQEKSYLPLSGLTVYQGIPYLTYLKPVSEMLSDLPSVKVVLSQFVFVQRSRRDSIGRADERIFYARYPHEISSHSITACVLFVS
jgi:hypothetical protein